MASGASKHLVWRLRLDSHGPVREPLAVFCPLCEGRLAVSFDPNGVTGQTGVSMAETLADACSRAAEQAVTDHLLMGCGADDETAIVEGQGTIHQDKKEPSALWYASVGEDKVPRLERFTWAQLRHAQETSAADAERCAEVAAQTRAIADHWAKVHKAVKESFLPF